MNNSEISTFIGMDGFHFTRKYLDNMENPKLAHQKRGAYWTFDVDGFSDLLKSISNDNDKKTIICPTFDHSIKDPTPNGKIKPIHKIIIVEGLYLFLNIKPWNKLILPYFNEKWLLNVIINWQKKNYQKTC